MKNAPKTAANKNNQFNQCDTWEQFSLQSSVHKSKHFLRTEDSYAQQIYRPRIDKHSIITHAPILLK